MMNETIDFLVQISDFEWGQYAFSRDPLNGKVSAELRQEMIERANECGKQQASKLKEKYPNLSVKDIASRLSLEIKYKESNGTDSYIMFACFNSPNKISLFMKNVVLVEEFIKEHNLSSKLENVDIESVLLAHEMFHYIEENNKDIYTKTTKIVLWKIGTYQYKSSLVALGEIAAMAFAKELLSLHYNPYVFDVLMLYPHDQNKTELLLNEIKGVITNE